MSPPPDVTLIFASDVLEWDAYLARQLDSSGCTLHRQQVERMSFPLGATRGAALSDSRAVLVVVSPALVRFADTRAADCYQWAKLLRPTRTIAMLCGAHTASIHNVKNVLVSYDEWRHLEAKDKDINMARDVIEMIHETLAQSRESERINKPKFKLVPRKVQEGNSKVYVMLAKPLDKNAKLRITLETSGSREVPVMTRNPYTLTFVIPDELIHVQNMVNVHVWCNEDLLGVSQVKCVSKLGELYSLLLSTTSPYEFLRNTLGVASIHEVDNQLSVQFRKNLPRTGFNLLHCDDSQVKHSTIEEYPTLLHFAARHGLFQLVKELLSCPGARTAAGMHNTRGLTPALLANHEGHVKTAAAIDDFLKSVNSSDIQDLRVPCPSKDPEKKFSTHADYYDIPAQPIPVLIPTENKLVEKSADDRDNEYLKMKGAHKENVEPSQDLFLQCKEHMTSQMPSSKESTGAGRTKLSILESQAKLIEIMEAYKKGSSLTEVETLHNEWKSFYQVSDEEAKSTLDGLRNLYAKAQKAKLNKKHSSSFSELRHFLNSKLRRRESIDSKVHRNRIISIFSGSLSRRNSKDSSCSDKTSHEADTNRPVSTLSVLSNTSSSSGSSFDRLSMASAGSDSGHHSDFGEDRNNKIKDRYESRQQQQRRANAGTIAPVSEKSALQIKLQSLTLNSKPPPPPPRPAKPHHGSLEDCKKPEVPQYAVSKKKIVNPSFEDTLKMLDYSIPSSRSSTLTREFKRDRKISLPSAGFFNLESPGADYDQPPPPISCPLIDVSFPHMEPLADYDIVPPPLPLSSPPTIDDVFQNYDIPPPTSAAIRQRSNSLSSDYDFPRLILSSSDQSASTLPSVPSVDVLPKEKMSRSKERSLQNQYCNVFLVPGRERDSIPEEIAPPPPTFEEDSEEHYKMVPAPMPISAGGKM